MDLNYMFPATLIKSGEETDGKIPIEIIPSEPSVDRVNDQIILKAFEDAREEFLNDGIIDYDHQSILGKNALEKSEAIIGEPIDLFIDKKRNVPVCHANIFKGNPYVDNVIMPHLNNKSKVFGASVGGKVLQKSFEILEGTKQKINKISKILLKHIAITPRQKAVHPKTSVQLLKSIDDCFDLILSDFDYFLKSFSDENFLQKTLMAGTSTDISNISGGQVLQNQSLEGDINYNKIKNILPFIVDGMVNVYDNYKNLNDWKNYLMTRGFNKNESLEIIKILIKNKAKIIGL